MILSVEATLDEAEIPEIWETEEEKELTFGELRAKYVIVAWKRFLKKPPMVLENKTTGWKIELTGRVLKEWRAKSRTRPRIVAIKILDTMIETAKLIKTEKDSKKTPNIAEVNEFENHCKINGILHRIHIIVKKQPYRRFVYYYGAVGIKKP
jgi:hypothetical protein